MDTFNVTRTEAERERREHSKKLGAAVTEEKLEAYGKGLITQRKAHLEYKAFTEKTLQAGQSMRRELDIIDEQVSRLREEFINSIDGGELGKTV